MSVPAATLPLQPSMAIRDNTRISTRCATASPRSGSPRAFTKKTRLVYGRVQSQSVIVATAHQMWIFILKCDLWSVMWCEISGGDEMNNLIMENILLSLMSQSWGPLFKALFTSLFVNLSSGSYLLIAVVLTKCWTFHHSSHELEMVHHLHLLWVPVLCVMPSSELRTFAH